MIDLSSLHTPNQDFQIQDCNQSTMMTNDEEMVNNPQNGNGQQGSSKSPPTQLHPLDLDLQQTCEKD